MTGSLPIGASNFRRGADRGRYAPGPVKILAIDHGNARAGCAICDPSETITRPLGVVEPPDPDAVIRLAHEQGAELIVVGLPVSLDGTEREQAAVAREFAAALADAAELPVETYDERLTTRMASQSARAGAAAHPDALAAAHLLDSYLLSRTARAGSGEAAER